MMPTYQFKDLKIEDQDVALDALFEPVYLYDRDVIAQDIQHAIQETGYLACLIAERNPALRQLIHQKIRIRVEQDLRVLPGTCVVTEIDLNRIEIQAQTVLGPVRDYLMLF